jgi:putative effector of murein hydrolase LrgA (UPF0299 family)
MTWGKSFMSLPISVGIIQRGSCEKSSDSITRSLVLVLRFSFSSDWIKQVSWLEFSPALLTRNIWLILVPIIHDVIVKPLTSFGEDIHNCKLQYSASP